MAEFNEHLCSMTDSERARTRVFFYAYRIIGTSIPTIPSYSWTPSHHLPLHTAAFARLAAASACDWPNVARRQDPTWGSLRTIG